MSVNDRPPAAIAHVDLPTLFECPHCAAIYPLTYRVTHDRSDMLADGEGSSPALFYRVKCRACLGEWVLTYRLEHICRRCSGIKQ